MASGRTTIIDTGLLVAQHEIWENEDSTKAAPVPRHQEIKDKLAAIICDQLGVPRVSKLRGDRARLNQKSSSNLVGDRSKSVYTSPVSYAR